MQNYVFSPTELKRFPQLLSHEEDCYGDFFACGRNEDGEMTFWLLERWEDIVFRESWIDDPSQRRDMYDHL